MIRLGSLAGYPFEGPRLLGGWTPPARAAVYAILYKADPDTKPDQYAVIYVGHSDDSCYLDIVKADTMLGFEFGRTVTAPAWG